MVERVCECLSGSQGRWLDIGFGNGAILTTAAEFGFEVVGLDLREAHVKRLRQFGYEAYVLEFEHYRPNDPFVVISMADVLEHMPFPKQAIRHAWSLLHEGGLLFTVDPIV